MSARLFHPVKEHFPLTLLSPLTRAPLLPSPPLLTVTALVLSTSSLLGSAHRTMGAALSKASSDPLKAESIFNFAPVASEMMLFFFFFLTWHHFFLPFLQETLLPFNLSFTRYLLNSSYMPGTMCSKSLPSKQLHLNTQCAPVCVLFYSHFSSFSARLRGPSDVAHGFFCFSDQCSILLRSLNTVGCCLINEQSFN